MPEYMSKSTLMNVGFADMEDPRSNGFAQAGESASTALELVEPTLGLIGPGPGHGGVWSGEGQPEASMVLEINRIALDVAKTEMESAKIAVHALWYALSDCRSSLKNFVETAESFNIDVAEDGTCTYRNPEDDRAGRGDPGLVRFTATVKQILKLATVADLDARSSLQKVAANTPPTSDTADPAVLQQAKDALDQALQDKGAIEESAALWLSSQAPTWEDYENGNSGGEQADRVLDYLLKTWTTLGPGGHTLITALRDGLGSVAVGVSQGILLKLFDPKKLAGRTLGAAGIGELAVEGVLGIISMYQETDDGLTPVKTNPDVRLVDPELADIAAQFYPAHHDTGHDGSGNLADLAHIQRVAGTPGDGADWVERAEQTRSRIQAWVDSHPDAADAPYANGLIHALDEGLGGVAPTGPESVPGAHGGKYYR